MRGVSGVLLVTAVVAAGQMMAAGQAGTLPAVDIKAAEIAAMAGPEHKQGTLPNIRVVDAGKHNIAVGALYRTAAQPQPVAVHYKVSEIYYVLKGSATLVTGGKVVNAKVRAADSAQVKAQDGPGESGTAIEGGVSREIHEGDVIVIPAGTPHWFSKIDQALGYMVIRVDPEQILDLK